MTPERLAELERRYGSLTPDAYAHDHPAAHAAELLAEVARLRREAAWHEPEAINTATGAPHRVTLNPDDTFTIRHNLGCHQHDGRREARGGKLICQLDSYLDQTDPDEHPGPGDYWVTVDVFGRSEDPVEAVWTAATPTAEVDRLNQRVTELIEQVGETKGESHERLLRVVELEGAALRMSSAFDDLRYNRKSVSSKILGEMERALDEAGDGLHAVLVRKSEESAR